MTKIRYGEGDWFSVPLEDGKLAVGLIARGKTTLFGYFFGPAAVEPPELSSLAHLSTDDSVLVGRFSDLDLRAGNWPVLGRVEGWDRTAWPMSAFIRHEEFTGRIYQVYYDDKNPSKHLATEVVPRGETVESAPDGLMGSRYVELALIRRLQSGE